jgi:hypothetical protein
MPSALGNGGAKIRFQGGYHPIHGCSIAAIHLLGHRPSILQEQGQVGQGRLSNWDWGQRCSHGFVMDTGFSRAISYVRYFSIQGTDPIPQCMRAAELSR